MMPENNVKVPMPTPMAMEIWYGRKRLGVFSVGEAVVVLITETTLVGEGPQSSIRRVFHPIRMSISRNVRGRVPDRA